MTPIIHTLDTDIDGNCETLLVAILDGQSVGCVHIKTDNELQVAEAAGIRRLFVHHQHRNKGIGSALVEAACALAKEQGCGAANLEVKADNIRTCDFYAKCGFFVGVNNSDGSVYMFRKLNDQAER